LGNYSLLNNAKPAFSIPLSGRLVVIAILHAGSTQQPLVGLKGIMPDAQFEIKY